MTPKFKSGDIICSKTIPSYYALIFHIKDTFYLSHWSEDNPNLLTETNIDMTDYYYILLTDIFRGEI